MQCHTLGTIFALLVAGAAGVADAAERMFQPIPSEGQQVRFEDGAAILTAQTSRAVLMVSFVSADKKSATVLIGVKNLSDSAFNFAETSVTASAASGPLAVMTYADRMKAQQSQERWSKFAAGMAAGAAYNNATTAGNEYQSGTYGSTTNASVYGQGATVRGTAQTTGSYSGTNYNALAAQQAQARADAQTQALFDTQQAQSESARQSLSGGALKANTLDPGELVTGDVQFSLPKRNKATPAEFILSIDVVGEPVAVLFREQQ